MKNLQKVMFWFLLSFWGPRLFASEALVEISSPSFGALGLRSATKAFVNPTETWESPVVKPEATLFRPMQEGGLSGLTSDGVGWLSFTLVSTQAPDMRVYLTTRKFFTRFVLFEERAGALHELADASALQKDNPFDNYLAPLAIPIDLKQGSQIFYIRFERKIPKSFLDLTLTDSERFLEMVGREERIRGVLFGIYIAIFFYIGFLFLKLKKIRYGIYSAYALCYAIWFSFASYLINLTNSLWLRTHWDLLSEISSGAALFLALWFASSFLDLKHRWSLMQNVIKTLSVTLVVALGYYMTNPALGFTLCRGLNIAALLVFLMLGVRVAWQGYRPAAFFTAGWTFPCLGGFITVLELLEVVRASTITDWAVHVGAAAEMIVLSLALSDRFQLEQRLDRERIADLNTSLEARNQDLAKSYRDLKQNEELRSQFFHNTSHELRTPLNGILGYLSMLQKGQLGVLSREAKEKVTILQNLSQCLKGQIDSILDLAQARRGGIKVQLSEVDLVQLRSSMQELAEGLCQKNEHVRFDSHMKLNEAGTSFVGDAEKISTILRNLIGNAIKFTDPERPNRVELTLEHKGNQLLIEVKDSGIGIPHSMLDKIFEEFLQVAGESRRRYEGSGVGLSLVKALVQAMGGHIAVESKEGEGSRFCITLPEGDSRQVISKGEVSEIALITEKAPEGGLDQELKLEGQLEGYRILVIDDHLENCEIMEACLRYQGAEVSSMRDARQALKSIQNERPDLILLDIMMPDFSGEDFLAALRMDPMLMDIPVVMLTAVAGDKERLQLFSLGADDYLTKPVAETELILRSRNLLQRLHHSHHVSGLLDREKVLLLGEMLTEVSHDIQNVFQNFVEDEDIVYDFSYLLRSIAPQGSPLVRLTEEGLDFDPNLLDPSAPYLPDLPSELAKKPYLRLLRLYLSGFGLSDAQRQELWHDWMSWPAERQEALSATLQILSVYLSLQEQSQDMRRLLDAMLTLCQDTRSGTACETSQVIGQTLCLVDSILREKNAKVQSHLTKHEWPIAAPEMMQILLELIHHLLQVFPSEGDAHGLTFGNGHDDHHMYLRVTRYGIPWKQSHREAWDRDLKGKSYAYEKFPQLLHAQRLARKSGAELHFILSDAGPCFEVRRSYEAASQLLKAG